jgi:hypothetical protein
MDLANSKHFSFIGPCIDSVGEIVGRGLPPPRPEAGERHDRWPAPGAHHRLRLGTPGRFAHLVYCLLSEQ